LEYLIGSLATLFSIVTVNFLLRKKQEDVPLKIKASQSYLYKLLSDISYREMEKANKEKQSDKYLNRHSVKVMILEDKAYWIRDNQLYVAEYHDGKIDNHSTKEVDTINMDRVELERTMFVVEKLAEEDK
jgi:hypothetical protein